MIKEKMISFAVDRAYGYLDHDPKKRLPKIVRLLTG